MCVWRGGAPDFLRNVHLIFGFDVNFCLFSYKFLLEFLEL